VCRPQKMVRAVRGDRSEADEDGYRFAFARMAETPNVYLHTTVQQSAADLRIRIAFYASHEMQRMSEETRCVVGNVEIVAVKVLDDLFEFQPFGQTQSDTRPCRLHFCLLKPHAGLPFSG